MLRREFDCVTNQVEQNLLNAHRIEDQFHLKALRHKQNLDVLHRCLPLKNFSNVSHIFQDSSRCELWCELTILHHTFVQ
mgnify:CR=1 FL=1